MSKIELFHLESATNGQGFFSVPHGLEKWEPNGYRIVGIVVAVQHSNGNWHTIELSHDVDNRFWWNAHDVQGMIASPNFVNRPVSIVVFARFVVG